MALVEEPTQETIEMISLFSEEPLDVHELSVLEDILRDITHKPIVKALQRRGAYTFIVGDDNLCLSMALKKQHTLLSKLKLGKSETFCTPALLKRVIPVACRQAGVTLIGVGTYGDGAQTHYAYTIEY